MTPEQIKDLLPEDELVLITKIGSSLFYDKPQDLDYFCVSANREKADRIKIESENGVLDLLILTPVELMNKLNFIDTYQAHSLYNYQLAKPEVLYKDDTFILEPFDMLNPNIKDLYLNSITEYYKGTLGLSIHKHRHSKMYTHYYLILKMYEDNTVEFTPEMVQTVKQLRDKTDGYEEIVEEIHIKLLNYYDKKIL